MKLRSDQTLKKEDINMLSLRQLYEHFGYVHYKMNKFEEYDLYAENKDFLAGDKIITFTDTNGKLLALKPDVTLSIVKNYNDIPGVVRKVYYNENIYRTSKSTKTYKEIMQMGLECIGDLDIYQIAEVLILAAASLSVLSEGASGGDTGSNSGRGAGGRPISTAGRTDRCCKGQSRTGPGPRHAGIPIRAAGAEPLHPGCVSHGAYPRLSGRAQPKAKARGNVPFPPAQEKPPRHNDPL